MAEVGSIDASGDVGGRVLTEANLSEPGLLEEPLLVTAFFPLGNIVRGQAEPVASDGINDVAVRAAFNEIFVNLLPNL